MQRRQIVLIVTLMAVTLLAGTIGHIMAGMPTYEGLVSSLLFLVMNGPAQPSNPAIEIARWAGVVFAMSVIYSIASAVVSMVAENVRLKQTVKDPDSVAVHGDGIFADKLADNMPRACVRSDKPVSFEAPVQVLMFSDDRGALDFLDANAERLARAREVYIRLDDIDSRVSKKGNIFIFNMAEICAQLYWKEHPVVRPEKIAMIGDGPYAEAILTQGLMVNIFSLEGGIEYTAIGDFRRYRALKPQLDEAMRLNSDTLRFSDAQWWEELEGIAAADRVVLCGSSTDNVEIAAKLRVYGVRASIHFRCDSDSCLGIVEEGAAGDTQETIAFGTSDELCTNTIVIQQKQHDAGKICDIAYFVGGKQCNDCKIQSGFPQEDICEGEKAAEKNSEIKQRRLASVDFGKCLECPKWDESWRSYNEFTRRSNYAVADHDGQKARLLAEAQAQCGCDFDDLPLQERDVLQEIEHIRWCRFHFLNNWRYGEKKDKQRRTHNYLVPYSQLERPIKDYDGDAYRTLSLRHG